MMALLTPPPTVAPLRPGGRIQPLGASGARNSAPNRNSDSGKLILIGEPGSGWRAVFDIIPGARIMVGRPNHASRHITSVAYLPSRAVSRMHAIITMEDDGLYLTHTKSTNLTWHAVDSTWTPMQPGDRTRIEHTDTICFGMAPKTRNHVNKNEVDTPFLVSVAIAPRGESATNKYQFVRKTIHRPALTGTKAKELDPGMQLLMNDLSGLNVSLDRAFSAPAPPPQEEEPSQPMGKRKRGAADEIDRADDATTLVDDLVTRMQSSAPISKSNGHSRQGSAGATSHSLSGNSAPAFSFQFGTAPDSAASNLLPTDLTTTIGQLSSGATTPPGVGNKRQRRVEDLNTSVTDLPESMRDMTLDI